MEHVYFLANTFLDLIQRDNVLPPSKAKINHFLWTRGILPPIRTNEGTMFYMQDTVLLYTQRDSVLSLRIFSYLLPIFPIAFKA